MGESNEAVDTCPQNALGVPQVHAWPRDVGVPNNALTIGRGTFDPESASHTVDRKQSLSCTIRAPVRHGMPHSGWVFCSWSLSRPWNRRMRVCRGRTTATLKARGSSVFVTRRGYNKHPTSGQTSGFKISIKKNSTNNQSVNKLTRTYQRTYCCCKSINNI